MSAFLATGFEGPSSVPSPNSTESSSHPSQFTPHSTIDQQHSARFSFSLSHSQLELQNQHYQAQLQLHHLQTQKQRQQQFATLARRQQPSVPAIIPTQPTTGHQLLNSVAYASAIPQSSIAVNSALTSAPSTAFATPHSHPRTIDSTAQPYPTPANTTPSSAINNTTNITATTTTLSPMDVLSAASLPDTPLAQVHPFQPSLANCSIASSQSPLPHGIQQSQTAHALGVGAQQGFHNGQGYGEPASAAAVLGTSSRHHQYSITSPNSVLLSTDDFLRRMSQSSIGSEVTQHLFDGMEQRVKLENVFTNTPTGYKIDARIIQKKDQIEELSTPGYKIPARSVEEVRTGQQFLIKLQFLRADGSHATEFPTMRLMRRNAINTSGEPVSEPEALTLEIIVRLEKSGQVRRGACAKCCHKYGPSSPILLLLDPLSPSPTDPAMYSHIDIFTGSLTLLAKVICSSTDHSERGNKDKYIFEFRVRRTSSMLNGSRSSMSPGLGEGPDNGDANSGEILASCATTPVMCSGHHKAKRLLVDQRVEKANKGNPTPKTKVIKRRKSAEGSQSPPHLVSDSDVVSEHVSTPASMSCSPSSHPTTSLTLTPSIVDTPMTSHDSQSPSSAQPLFPLQPEPVSRVTPQPQYQQRLDLSLDQYASATAQLDSTLVLAAPSTSTANLSTESEVLPSPLITEIRPNQGPIRKVTHVAIRGHSFRAGMVPFFGCFPATDIVIETSSLILCGVPESPLPGKVPVMICEGVSTSYGNLSEFTYTDDNETELLILQLQLRMAHRALEYLHAQATGQQGTAADILRSIPTYLSSSPPSRGTPQDDVISHAVGTIEESQDSYRRPLTLEQVEQGLLKTVEHLPIAIDLSMQLEDGSSLLHLSILMGFVKLSLELIQLGCEIEARDRWGFTPLMYAVFKGQTDVVRALVQAGATSGGAKTSAEFYTHLPRPIEQHAEISALLGQACSRYQSPDHLQWRPGAPHPLSTDDESNQEMDKGVNASSQVTPSDETMRPLSITDSTAESNGNNSRNNNTTDEAVLSRLPRLLEGLHILRPVPPHRQQSLPLLQDAGKDESGALSPRTITSREIAEEPDATMETMVPSSKVEAQQQQQQESGYHSGIISEVQDRLKEMHRQPLPAEGVEMSVKLRRLESNLAKSTPSSSSAMAAATTTTPGRPTSSVSKIDSSISPLAASAVSTDPFRTGDFFAFDIDLAINPMLIESLALPREFLGLRFPHQMVKRTNGIAPALLDEMTYDLKCSVELGPHNDSSSVASDNIVSGACKDCSKWLHEQGKLSPSRSMPTNPSWYPVLQFGIPLSHDQYLLQQLQQHQHGGVMEVRQGHCEAKARVNCSSMHHLVLREKARFLTIKREREQIMAQLEKQGSCEFDPNWKVKLQEEASRTIRELKDPGYVFVFELSHPVTKEVVATARTAPVIFRTFQRHK